MIPVERRQKIMTLVAEKGIIRISELTEQLGVSHMTVRRDIQTLEENGMLVSVSGGIQSVKRLTSEPSHQIKATLCSQQKSIIGDLAAQQIPENATIYLDAGTTTLEIARQLIDRADLTVISNDFVIINFLIESSACRLIHTGGMVCRENRSCVGEAAAQSLRNLFIDIAFISASSWSLKGITTPNEDKVPVKRAIIDASAKRFLVCDSSKYGKIATFLAVPMGMFDGIISDDSLPVSAQEAIIQSRIELILPNTYR